MVTINSLIRHNSRGFGLVELLVSIAIITMVTSIVVSRHNAFNGAVLLRNQAYEVAFAIRKAQQLAVSGTASVSTEKQRVGIAFARTTNLTGVRNQIIIFRDKPDAAGIYNGVYNPVLDELVQNVTLDKRFEIVGLYGGGLTDNRATMNVVFERPLFDANFRRATGNGFAVNGPVYIHIGEVPGNAVRVIEVTSSGQVTVQ